MPLDRALSCALFFLVMSITPGPNNVMLLASGVNFGFRRSIPHIAGIAVGSEAMLIAIGFGLGQMFVRWPSLHTGLQIAGSAYLLWLAWRIANAGPVERGEAGARPLTLLEAALFQLLNPKGWIMLVTAVASFTAADAVAASMIAMIGIFSFAIVAGTVPWVAGGMALRGFLGDARRVRIFNIAMAVLLVTSLWPIVAGLLPR